MILDIINAVILGALVLGLIVVGIKQPHGGG